MEGGQRPHPSCRCAMLDSVLEDIELATTCTSHEVTHKKFDCLNSMNVAARGLRPCLAQCVGAEEWLPRRPGVRPPPASFSHASCPAPGTPVFATPI